MYYHGIYVKKDINKAIHYFKLAENKSPKAQFILGRIYSDGIYVKRDINLSIKYLTKSANNYSNEAQFFLGLIYLSGNGVPLDFTKGIDYLKLAAKNGHDISKLLLSYISFSKSNRVNGVDYILQSSENSSHYFNFIKGYIYQAGITIERDINKAIHYYKEASSFNNHCAKNNLGIIYKHGVENQIEKNIGYAIEYFSESIKHDNDRISMYNLAHLYLYEEPIENSIQESIKLLIKSSEKFFYPAKVLLCLASIIEFGFNEDTIINELKKIDHLSNELERSIHNVFKYEKLEDINAFDEMFTNYRDLDFIYDLYFMCYPLKDLQTFIKNHPINEREINNINSDFYEGFGLN